MTSMMMERPSVASTGMTHGMTAPVSMPSMMMVPRCTFKIEKCQGGMKITCVCDDPTAKSMVQNLCSALMGGLCSVCCTMNGTTVCCCNLTMGMCKCEMTDKGCCVTCVSGDQKCCEMIQSCCDCICTMQKAGCTCCLLMNNTPVCCGC